MALAEGALGGLAHRGESRNQDVVERLAFGELLAEFGGSRLQRLIREASDFSLDGIDGTDAGLISLHTPVIGGAEKLAGERADHAKILFSRSNSSRRGEAPVLPINSP